MAKPLNITPVADIKFMELPRAPLDAHDKIQPPHKIASLTKVSAKFNNKKILVAVLPGESVELTTNERIVNILTALAKIFLLGNLWIKTEESAKSLLLRTTKQNKPDEYVDITNLLLSRPATPDQSEVLKETPPLDMI